MAKPTQQHRPDQPTRYEHPTVVAEAVATEERREELKRTEERARTEERRRTLRSDILFTFTLGISLALAFYLRHVLLLLYVSALFAVVLMPVVRGVQRLRIGRWHPGPGAAIAFLLIAVAGGITLFVTFALPPVVNDMREFVKELPTRGPELLSRLKHLPFASRLDVTALNAKLQDYASNFVGYLLTSASSWADKVFKIVTGVVLTVYFMLEGENAYHWVLSFIPSHHRERLNQTLLRAEVRMGKWLLGQASLMLILGLYSTAVFALLHIRYAYALGVLMGVFNIIPVIGAMVSMALVILAAAMDSWPHVLYVLIAYAVYAQVENSYLTPKIMQSSVDLAGLAIIVSLILGSELAGVVGAMVSVPTAVLVAVLLEEYAVQPDTRMVVNRST
jgi:predicted PurR-regulated permease PerM